MAARCPVGRDRRRAPVGGRLRGVTDHRTRGRFPALFLPAGIPGRTVSDPHHHGAWALVAVGAMSLAAGALLTADGWAANATWAAANTAEALAVAGCSVGGRSTSPARSIRLMVFSRRRRQGGGVVLSPRSSWERSGFFRADLHLG